MRSPVEDHALAHPRKMADVEAAVLTAHEIDQIDLIGIGQMMGDGGRGKAHEIAGTDLDDLAVDLRAGPGRTE